MNGFRRVCSNGDTGKREISLNRRPSVSPPVNDRRNPWEILVAVQVSIAELAEVLRTGRSAVGGESIEIGHQLEMAELDLLSVQDALERACWQAHITAMPCDVRSFERSAGPVSLAVAPPAETLASSKAEPARRRGGAPTAAGTFGT